MAEMTPEIEARIASMVDTLRWHRKQKGWTQAQLAELLGVQPNTVAHLETGRQIPNLVRLAQWAGLFDLQVGLFAMEVEEDQEDIWQEEDDLDDVIDAIEAMNPRPPAGYEYRARVAA